MHQNAVIFISTMGKVQTVAQQDASELNGSEAS